MIYESFCLEEQKLNYTSYNPVRKFNKSWISSTPPVGVAFVHPDFCKWEKCSIAVQFGVFEVDWANDMNIFWRLVLPLMMQWSVSCIILCILRTAECWGGAIDNIASGGWSCKLLGTTRAISMEAEQAQHLTKKGQNSCNTSLASIFFFDAQTQPFSVTFVVWDLP